MKNQKRYIIILISFILLIIVAFRLYNSNKIINVETETLKNARIESERAIKEYEKRTEDANKKIQDLLKKH